MLSTLKMGYLSVTHRLGWVRENTSPHLLLLIYHRIGSGMETAMDVSARTFELHLDYLERQYEIISLSEAVNRIRTRSLHKRAAVLTFDDGYHDFCANALPILVRRKLPAILYIATKFIDTGERFPWDVAIDPQRWPHVRPLTWNELGDILTSGLVDIGSHTHTHARIDRVANEQLEVEIAESNRLIQSHLGIKPRHFACPKGILSRTQLPVLQHHFDTVTVSGWRLNRSDSIDLYRLRRIPAVPTPDIGLFAHTLTGVGWPIAAMERLRYRFTG